MKNNKISIKIRKIDKSVSIPEYAHDGDAGSDLRSSIDVEIKPGERILVPTGIAVQIPKGYAGFVQPRSGLALKHGISVLNTPGLIDSKYRGEIKVILINLDERKPFIINKGDRVAQLVIQNITEADFVEVNELDETIRGDGGFGSTGY